MTSRLMAVCFEAHDPAALARFWAGALRWQVDDGGTALVPTDGTAFRIVFLPSNERKTGKNRIHLDLTTASPDDQSATVEGLLAHGARHVDVGQRGDEPHVVLADPEGNELCIIEPHNSFLAGCGRLGSITCDGSPTVGRFWSEALGWPLVWDQDEETAVRAPDHTGPFITWGPPVPTEHDTSRLHLHIAPVGGDAPAEVDRLCSLGAAPVARDRDRADRVVMIDPDGNRFCIVPAR